MRIKVFGTEATVNDFHLKLANLHIKERIVPVTWNYDVTHCVGMATLSKEDDGLYADVEFNGQQPPLEKIKGTYPGLMVQTHDNEAHVLQISVGCSEHADPTIKPID